jgi:hypothetical protein
MMNGIIKKFLVTIILLVSMTTIAQKNKDTLIFIEDKRHNIIKQVLPENLWKTMDSIYYLNPIKYDSLIIRLQFPNGKNIEKMFSRKIKYIKKYETSRLR